MINKILPAFGSAGGAVYKKNRCFFRIIFLEKIDITTKLLEK